MGAVPMKNAEWLSRLSNLTGLPYYEQHRIFGDKSGALIGVTDGYIVALGLGKGNGGHAAVKALLRYATAPDRDYVRQALTPAKGKFKLVAGETTTTLIQTYSFVKPEAAELAERMRELLTALKTCASPIHDRCEECGRAEPQILLLNDLPAHYCSGCQVQLTEKLNAAAIAYENLETNLPRGLLYGVAAALLGSVAWGGVAYLLDRVFLWGAILIGLAVGKAVVKGTGKVTWAARIMIGAMTIASVAFGDSIYYALMVMKENQLALAPALKLVLLNFWKLEHDSEGGLISALFGLIGAGVVMYGTRKPAFKARFAALGTPATTLSQAATNWDQLLDRGVRELSGRPQQATLRTAVSDRGRNLPATPG